MKDLLLEERAVVFLNAILQLIKIIKVCADGRRCHTTQLKF